MEKPMFSRPSNLVLSVSPRHCGRRTGFMIASSSRAAQIIKLEREGRHNGKKKKRLSEFFHSAGECDNADSSLTLPGPLPRRLCRGRCNTPQHLICSGFYQFSSNLQLFNRNRNLCHCLDSEDAALRSLAQMWRDMAALCSPASLTRRPSFNSQTFMSVEVFPFFYCYFLSRSLQHVLGVSLGPPGGVLTSGPSHVSVFSCIVWPFAEPG